MTRPILGALAALLLAGSAAAQDAPALLTGQDALGDWRADRPGQRRLLTIEDQAEPFVTESASNSADRVRMPADARPALPPGFSAELIASGVRNPRAVRVAPNGDVFVADSRANAIRVYRLPEGGGEAEASTFAGGLNRPYGIAFHPAADPRWVYVANTNGVVRFPYAAGDREASGAAEEIVGGLPAGGHWTRDLAFSADGETMFVSVGSRSNVAQDMAREPRGGLESWVEDTAPGAAWGPEENRAAVLAFDPEGGNQRVFATGLRNCSGLTVQPATGALWCAVNERDGLGDDVPFEYATSVRDGGFYGWPWFYPGGAEDPRKAGQRADLAGTATTPDVLIQPHSAPLGIAFYDGESFPEDYRGDAFVALHGSWNRGVRTGYKVVRLIFEDGRPTGEYEDFMTGFVVSDAEVWGRPVGVAVAGDGSLIVTEDGSGTIWRVTHDGS